MMTIESRKRPFVCAFASLLAVTQFACHKGPGESASDTATAGAGSSSSGEEPEVGEFCAVPQFGSGVGPGQSYTCHGNVAGFFQYNVCKIANCQDVEQSDIDGDAADTDHAIEFPGDPTEGAPDVVEACCDPDVELAEDGIAQAKAACQSDCAHAACNRAIDQFKDLLDDSSTDDACMGLGGCEANVKKSLEFFLGQIQENFDQCVQIIGDGETSTKFGLGTPPGCGDGNLGCLVLGVLDVNCSVDSVDFNSNTESCSEALAQPPTAERQGCEIVGGQIEISDDTASDEVEILGGEVVAALFSCGEAECPYVLETLTLRVDEIAFDGGIVSDVNVNLYIEAIGMSDGENVEFPAGAIRASVTGNYTDGTGSLPFSGVADSVETTFGRHANDTFELDEVVFEVDGYTFTAFVDEADCDDI
jgi:hypothetical protein